MRRTKASRLITAVSACLLLACTGCGSLGQAPAPSPSHGDAAVHQSLKEQIGDLQGQLWEAHTELLAKPGSVSGALHNMEDMRGEYDNPKSPNLLNWFTLLDATTTKNRPTYTIAVMGWGGAGTEASPASYWYTCVTMVVRADRVDTKPSNCSDARGRTLSHIQRLADEGRLVPLTELDVRRTVTVSDYPTPSASPCACYSGSPCECPGG